VSFDHITDISVEISVPVVDVKVRLNREAFLRNHVERRGNYIPSEANKVFYTMFRVELLFLFSVSSYNFNIKLGPKHFLPVPESFRPPTLKI